MKRHINSVACALPALTLLLASCTADKIEVPDKELYTREFIKQFGTFSSDAGWNSATRVTANIDPSIVAGGTDIKVFTAWPTNPDCRIVASFPASTTNFEFDYPDGLEYAYVQVLDANGTSVYGGYTRVTDGQLNVGQAGRASRADEPDRYRPTLYCYDLTQNPALGTFLVDEEYNRTFWKDNGLNLYSEKKESTSEIQIPDGIDTETEHPLWSGTQDAGNWVQFILNGSKDEFAKAKSNAFIVTVKGRKNGDKETKFRFYYETSPGTITGDNGLSTGERIPDSDEFTIETIFHKDDASHLKTNNLALKGVGVEYTSVSFREAPYEGDGIGNPNATIDPTHIYKVFSGNHTLSEWNSGTNFNLENLLANTNSNNIELTITVKIDNPNAGQHMFSVQREDNSDIFGSGNIVSKEETHTTTVFINENKLADLRNKAHIAGTNLTITSISYTEHAYRPKTTGGQANFSDLFKLYGLTTTSGVSNMEGYKNNALKPYNDYQPDGYSAHDLVSLVGSESGVFHEEVNKTNNQCNLIRFKDKLLPKEGVDYQLKEEGEVSLDYFFGCASTFNSFGYFYYTDDEANLNEQEFVKTLLRKPKFILMYRAFPHSNIKIKKNAGEWGQLTDLATIGDNNIVLRGDDEGKDKSDNWEHCGEFTRLVDQAEAAIKNGTAETNRANQYPRFQSANYRLVYFSPDQFEDDGVTLKPNQQGKYKFPAGTHIAFFVINGGQYALQQGEKSGFKIDHTRISFSRPLLNKYLGNVFNADGHSHSANTTPSTNIAGPNAVDEWTPFVTYKWGGDIIMGVEDYFARTHDGINGSDHDMNDMLFKVNGEFVRDREEMNPNTPKSQNWIIACEDLGGTHDFDFNDVVFGVTHVAGEPTATVTALASGGTLPVYLESIYRQTSNSSSGVTREDNITYYTLTPEGTGDGEFHKWWGANNHHSGIINAKGWGGKGAEIQIQVGDDFTLSDVTKTKPGTVENGATNMGGFRVRVKRSDKESITISAPTRNPLEPGYEAPQMFLVPHTWYWPQENQFILDVYPKFNEWGEGVNWWNNANGPDKENVIKHNWVPTTPATTTK